MSTHRTDQNLLNRQQRLPKPIGVGVPVDHDDPAVVVSSPGEKDSSLQRALLKQEAEETNGDSDLQLLPSIFSRSLLRIPIESDLYFHDTHQLLNADSPHQATLDRPSPRISSRDDFGTTRVETEARTSRQAPSPLRSTSAQSYSKNRNPEDSGELDREKSEQREDCLHRDIDFVKALKLSPFRVRTSPSPSFAKVPSLKASTPSFDSLTDDLPSHFSSLKSQVRIVTTEKESASSDRRSYLHLDLYLKPPRPTKRSVQTMASVMTSKQPRKNLFRPRLSLSRPRGGRADENDASVSSNVQSARSRANSDNNASSARVARRTSSGEEPFHNSTETTRPAVRRAATDLSKDEQPRRGVLQRLRSVSRSRAVSRNVQSDSPDDQKPILVAVTSCRSDAYYNQKAPGSTTKLPRKAPSNLKLFHELATGIKDAYAAVGKTPTKPDDDNCEEETNRSKAERDGNKILWDFIGHLDFLLSLVDEVAVDTATRGALKDDTTFKGLRDVIKKCNKVLEGMLVRRERRYTLFFRLIQWSEAKEVAKLKAWNVKVEKAVGQVADSPNGDVDESDTESDSGSVQSMTTDNSSQSGRSGRGNMFSRGRQLLPAAGKVRGRRATPTPALRNRAGKIEGSDSHEAADDGFAAAMPVTATNLAGLQRSMSYDSTTAGGMTQHMTVTHTTQLQLAASKTVEPKDELIDVIRGLRAEQKQKREGTAESDLATLKPNWLPKAEIPSSVPKLPTEYIHRHRLMKQVVNCLLEHSGTGPIDTDDNTATNTNITSITSRHADKPGNGKTTLAVATIQTVEVRERFSDGIAWIQLGRTPLTEKEIRRLYEELFRQLVSKDRGDDDDDDDEGLRSKSSSPEGKSDDGKPMSRNSSITSLDKLEKAVREKQEHAIRLAESRQRFQGGELEAIKEDLERIITKRKILICLDDVWRVDDAKWFIFDTRNAPVPARQPGQPQVDPNPFRILVTTRTPSLFGNGIVQEVFVRIFSEHEAVKLLLSSAGRRPYGGKASAVFNQARTIVKGCGNAPMAVRLAGGMLRRSNRNWNTNCPTWNMLIQQCRLNLEEASRLRSFVNSVVRVVDLSFASITNMELRIALRRCFVTFALAFKENDWVHVGRGIPQPVLLKIFDAVINSESNSQRGSYSAESILTSLETMNLIQRARHGVSSHYYDYTADDGKSNSEDDDDKIPEKSAFIQNPSFVMHASLQAIAEDVATRNNLGLLPVIDDFTSFGGELLEEKKFHVSRAGIWTAPLRFLAKQLSSGGASSGMADNGVHELVVVCLLGIKGSFTSSAVVDSFLKSKISTSTAKGGDKLNLYMCTFLPTHLIRAEAFAAAGELMTNPQFIRRRVVALGITEATRRHMSDLLELRRDVVKPPSMGPNSGRNSAPQSPMKPNGSISQKPVTPPNGSLSILPSIEQIESTDSGNDVPVENVDTSTVLREGSRAIVNEVHHVVSMARGSTESLGMAICLSTVGEGLLKGKQPRDAMLRLEEAVIIYRGLLGQNHIDVARSLHSVARALVKLGENRVALHKFSEAAQIYQACNATMLFDSIANTQNLAALLVDLGEWDKANVRYEDVITKKKAIYGEGSVAVAKTINSYAILLAKHSRMNEALKNYIAAKETYEAVPQSLLKDPEFDIKCKYDMTLINLNIASIRSKKGDIKGAIESYEDGVRGLQEYAAAHEKLQIHPGMDEAGKNPHLKHLVAALGRIGSLKLKIGDTKGALDAYQTLLDEVGADGPIASRIEKAKAHIKCATIYRQEEGRESHSKAITHLREALEMYTNLFGPDHKDTLAIASSLRQWLAE